MNFAIAVIAGVMLSVTSVVLYRFFLWLLIVFHTIAVEPFIKAYTTVRQKGEQA